MKLGTWMLLAACGVAGTVACSGSNTGERARDTRDAARAGQTAEHRDSEASRPPVTLEGCLQQGGGVLRSGYLLTLLNEPSGSVGTSGGSVTKSGSSVEREQMRIAARTYRLEPKGDLEFDNMLGKQVRVTGHITEPSDLPNDKGSIGSDTDTQRPHRDREADRGPELNVRDLAKMEVTTASVVSETCGDPRMRRFQGAPGAAGDTGATGAAGGSDATGRQSTPDR